METLNQKVEILEKQIQSLGSSGGPIDKDVLEMIKQNKQQIQTIKTIIKPTKKKPINQNFKNAQNFFKELQQEQSRVHSKPGSERAKSEKGSLNASQHLNVSAGGRPSPTYSPQKSTGSNSNLKVFSQPLMQKTNPSRVSPSRWMGHDQVTVQTVLRQPLDSRNHQ